MHLVARLAAGLAGAAVFGLATAAGAAEPAYVAAAVANAARPDTDRQRDADRKPAEAIAFSGMRPGWKVADFIPGTGYYDRIFSAVVGPRGHVYAFFPAELTNITHTPMPPTGARPYPQFPNVTAVTAPVNDFAVPEALDLVWLSDNYHDLHDPFFGPADLAKVNHAVFAALKPGGIYFIIDHAAQDGAGFRDTNTLHRIDKAALEAEVEAAGFVLVGESPALRNPADDHTRRIFDPTIRGHTDQFVLKFRKPA
jgi:predicted methyltransferase